MSYSRWFKEHGDKHRVILEKLKDLDDDEIIKYFRFDNMVKNEPDFCPLYKDNKKCHNIELLNCYLCACPNFRFSDSGFGKQSSKTVYSYCHINSKDGDRFETDSDIHQDCSKCLVPHDEAYIKKYFSRDWFLSMQDVNCS